MKCAHCGKGIGLVNYAIDFTFGEIPEKFWFCSREHRAMWRQANWERTWLARFLAWLR